MDITLNISIKEASPAFSLSELRKALEEYATQWIEKSKVKNLHRTNEFELPAKFEKLCGSISQEKLKSLSVTDERIDHLLS